MVPLHLILLLACVLRLRSAALRHSLRSSPSSAYAATIPPYPRARLRSRLPLPLLPACGSPCQCRPTPANLSATTTARQPRHRLEAASACSRSWSTRSISSRFSFQLSAGPVLTIAAAPHPQEERQGAPSPWADPGSALQVETRLPACAGVDAPLPSSRLLMPVWLTGAGQASLKNRRLTCRIL